MHVPMKTSIAASDATPAAAPSSTNSARIASTAQSATPNRARRRFGGTPSLYARSSGAGRRSVDYGQRRPPATTRICVGPPTVRQTRPCDVLAHRPLQERADLGLLGGGQLLQREAGRPHVALVEGRGVAEPQRRVPRLELLRALEEADDLAVLRVGGHPVPGLRRQGRRARLDEGVEPFGHGAVCRRHLGDLREHVALSVGLRGAAALGALQLPAALPHRGLLLGGEALRRRALGALLRRLLSGLGHCCAPVIVWSTGTVTPLGSVRPQRPT